VGPRDFARLARLGRVAPGHQPGGAGVARASYRKSWLLKHKAKIPKPLLQNRYTDLPLIYFRYSLVVHANNYSDQVLLPFGNRSNPGFTAK
jgi:hypothetical protein